MFSSGFSGQEHEIGVATGLDRADLPPGSPADGAGGVAGGGEQRRSG